MTKSNEEVQHDVYLRNYKKMKPKDYDKNIPACLRKDDEIRMAPTKYCGCCNKYHYIGEFLDSVFDTDVNTYCSRCR